MFVITSKSDPAPVVEMRLSIKNAEHSEMSDILWPLSDEDEDQVWRFYVLPVVALQRLIDANYYATGHAPFSTESFLTHSNYCTVQEGRSAQNIFHPDLKEEFWCLVTHRLSSVGVMALHVVLRNFVCSRPDCPKPHYSVVSPPVAKIQKFNPSECKALAKTLSITWFKDATLHSTSKATKSELQNKEYLTKPACVEVQLVTTPALIPLIGCSALKSCRSHRIYHFPVSCPDWNFRRPNISRLMTESQGKGIQETGYVKYFQGLTGSQTTGCDMMVAPFWSACKAPGIEHEEVGEQLVPALPIGGIRPLIDLSVQDDSVMGVKNKTWWENFHLKYFGRLLESDVDQMMDTFFPEDGADMVSAVHEHLKDEIGLKVHKCPADQKTAIKLGIWIAAWCQKTNGLRDPDSIGATYDWLVRLILGFSHQRDFLGFPQNHEDAYFRICNIMAALLPAKLGTIDGGGRLLGAFHAITGIAPFLDDPIAAVGSIPRLTKAVEWSRVAGKFCLDIVVPLTTGKGPRSFPIEDQLQLKKLSRIVQEASSASQSSNSLHQFMMWACTEIEEKRRIEPQFFVPVGFRFGRFYPYENDVPVIKQAWVQQRMKRHLMQHMSMTEEAAENAALAIANKYPLLDSTKNKELGVADAEVSFWQQVCLFVFGLMYKPRKERVAGMNEVIMDFLEENMAKDGTLQTQSESGQLVSFLKITTRHPSPKMVHKKKDKEKGLPPTRKNLPGFYPASLDSEVPKSYSYFPGNRFGGTQRNSHQKVKEPHHGIFFVFALLSACWHDVGHYENSWLDPSLDPKKAYAESKPGEPEHHRREAMMVKGFMFDVLKRFISQNGTPEFEKETIFEKLRKLHRETGVLQDHIVLDESPYNDIKFSEVSQSRF